jgi:oligopeptide transport system substrate-binding protein
MAESWQVSDDGLVWTFQLRDANWSDGEPVTADDFVFAMRRILNPETLSQYASLLFLIENAEDVNTGALPPEELGVVALSPRELEITLEHPAPYLPGLLTHYTSYPVPAHLVQEYGDAWIQPANVEVNGAYKLVDWRSNDFVHITKNDAFYDAQNVCIEDIYFYPTVDVNAAERRVRSGELDINTAFPAARLEALMEEIPEYVRVHPYLMTSYLSFNMTAEPFDDVRVRQALAMAIDVDFIVSEVLADGRVVANSLIPPGVANYTEGPTAPWAGEPIAERRAQARRLLEDAGFGPDNPLRFEYTHRNTRDNPRVAPRLQSDWSQIAPWVQADIAGVEAQIHYANMRAGDYEVGDGGWVADYNDPQNFLFLFETRSGPLNYPKYSDPDYDRLVAESSMILDVDERAAVMAEAEAILLEDTPIALTWHEVNKNLVSPRVTGWVDNVVDIHRARYLCIADAEE